MDVCAGIGTLETVEDEFGDGVTASQRRHRDVPQPQQHSWAITQIGLSGHAGRLGCLNALFDVVTVSNAKSSERAQS